MSVPVHAVSPTLDDGACRVLTVVALEKAGPILTLNGFVKAMESIKGYRDIFNGPEVSFGPDKHQGANSSFLVVVKGGRWVRVTDPLNF